MRDKICLITGATSGIGRAAALALAKLGATVVIVSRNETSGEIVANSIKKESANHKVCFLSADLSSQASIRLLANEFNARFPRLDVLINNAGVFYSELKYSLDGIEMQFAVNYLAGFLLSLLVVEKINQSPNGRIINVASRGHKLGKINFEDINLEKKYDGLVAYTQSKLANILFTYRLAEKLKGTGITVNCLHPGGVRTRIGTSNSKGFYHWLWKLNPFLKSPESGAQTIVYLAESKEVEGLTGKYFYNCSLANSSKRSHDKEVARELWDLSLKFTSFEIDPALDSLFK